jgi:hypothetical protein
MILATTSGRCALSTLTLNEDFMLIAESKEQTDGAYWNTIYVFPSTITIRQALTIPFKIPPNKVIRIRRVESVEAEE